MYPFSIPPLPYSPPLPLSPILSHTLPPHTLPHTLSPHTLSPHTLSPTHSSFLSYTLLLPPYVFSCFPPTHTPSPFFQGTLRVLLVLLHDFPEFLCDYHFSFCDVIPPNCIQMRNLILSAFPRNMRLPDPFTPNLKVTRPLKLFVSQTSR